jgi:2-amino-4-hydroxy-6-hydroxymethyldihydropteridine diphosphokinase
VSAHTVAAAFVGLGSNLDRPRVQIERALCALAELAQTRVVAHSRLYRSPPWAWGGVAQPDYVNAVARLDTRLDAQTLLRSLLAIEEDFGRRRDGQRYGPRILDLDLLVYGDARIDEPGLQVPHPHLHERAFVLVPLVELAPALNVPGQGRVTDLLARIDATDCVPLADS